MTFINPARYFPQKATYWAQKKQDGYGGETWDPPVVIDCRWEDRISETLSVAYKAEGETTVSDAHVYTPLMLKQGGYLYKGITTEANPSRLKNPNAFVIRYTASTPSVKGQFMENISFL